MYIGLLLRALYYKNDRNITTEKAHKQDCDGTPAAN